MESSRAAISGMTFGITSGINLGIITGIIDFIKASIPGTYLTIFIIAGKGTGIAGIVCGISSTIRSVL